MKKRQSGFNNILSFMKGVAIITLLVFIVAGCSQERDIRAYYFPIKNLQSGLVYEYHSVGRDSFPPAHWYYRSFISGDSVYLTGTKYDERILPEQFVREELVSNGMLIAENFLYEIDTLGRQFMIPVRVVAGNTYPFIVNANKEETFVQQTMWDSKIIEGISYEIVKNRKFKGDTTITIMNKEYPAIIFEVKEALDQKQDGVLTLEATGTEIYAKDLGLVAFEKNFDNGLNLAFKLKITYSMEILEYKYIDVHGVPDNLFDLESFGTPQ